MMSLAHPVINLHPRMRTHGAILAKDYGWFPSQPQGANVHMILWQLRSTLEWAR